MLTKQQISGILKATESKGSLVESFATGSGYVMLDVDGNPVGKMFTCKDYINELVGHAHGFVKEFHIFGMIRGKEDKPLAIPLKILMTSRAFASRGASEQDIINELNRIRPFLVNFMGKTKFGNRPEFNISVHDTEDPLFKLIVANTGWSYHPTLSNMLLGLLRWGTAYTDNFEDAMSGKVTSKILSMQHDTVRLKEAYAKHGAWWEVIDPSWFGTPTPEKFCVGKESVAANTLHSCTGIFSYLVYDTYYRKHLLFQRMKDRKEPIRDVEWAA